MRRLVNQYGTIVVEDLNVKALAAGMLAKSVHDAGWSMFVAKLSYKAECAGRRLVKVDPRANSQTCVCAQVILSRAGTRPSGGNVEDVVSCVS